MSAPDAATSDARTASDVQLAQADQRGAAVTVPAQDTRPAGPPWAGVYESDGVWDLSGPITRDRGLGDIAADFMVDEIVSLAGVPDALEDRAKDAVRDLIADKVKSSVDGRLPPELRPGSPLMLLLGTTLASTEVASTITLAPGKRAEDVTGTEELRSFAFTIRGQRLTLSRDELLGPNAIVGLGTDLQGHVNGADSLSLDDHALGVRYGKLLLWLAARTIPEDELGALTKGAAAAIECDLLTTALLDGKDELRFGVGFASFSVGPDKIKDGCLAVMGRAQEKAFGLFDLDTPVQMGGEVQFLDDNADRLADRLLSKPGYGGIVAVVHEAVAPRLAVRFVARRQR